MKTYQDSLEKKWISEKSPLKAYIGELKIARQSPATHNSTIFKK